MSTRRSHKIHIPTPVVIVGAVVGTIAIANAFGGSPKTTHPKEGGSFSASATPGAHEGASSTLSPAGKAILAQLCPEGPGSVEQAIWSNKTGTEVQFPSGLDLKEDPVKAGATHAYWEATDPKTKPQNLGTLPERLSGLGSFIVADTEVPVNVNIPRGEYTCGGSGYGKERG